MTGSDRGQKITAVIGRHRNAVREDAQGSAPDANQD